MPANLTPEYKAAEAEYRQARTPEDRLAWLREMLRTIPKHKGTDHLRATSRPASGTSPRSSPRPARAVPGATDRGTPGGCWPGGAARSALHARLTGSLAVPRHRARRQRLGFLHVKDGLAGTARDAPFPSSALHPLVRLGIHTPLDDAPTAMRAAGTHLVAVTSGTGAAVGYVTMEDVLQQRVGPSGPSAGGA